MSELVFLVEEPSMKVFLENLLPRLVPGTAFLILAHKGKSDLEKSLPRKLRAWRSPSARFVVVRDQDSADCRAIKARLASIATEAGRPEAVIRIACRELESWLLGDMEGLATAFGIPGLHSNSVRAKFRNPDTLGSPSRELKRLVPLYQKVSGARLVGAHVDVGRSQSPSFRAFALSVANLAADLHRASL